MVSDSDSESPGLVKVAKDLLLDAGAEFGSAECTLRAIQDILSGFHEHLLPRLGDGGFRAIVELAHRRSIYRHAILETVVVEPDGPRILHRADPGSSTSTEGPLGSALVDFLAELLSVVREVAQDQDWKLVEIWPGLEMLREQGVPLEPEGTSAPKSPDDASDPEL